jgi:hypothetical protein
MSDHLGWAQVFTVLGCVGVFTALWTAYMSISYRRRHADRFGPTAPAAA